MFVLR
jgi:hypothetical protein